MNQLHRTHLSDGRVRNYATQIPYMPDPVPVGVKPPRALSVDAFKNKRAFLPHNITYTIECRLLISKYDNGEAHKRCREIHGTSFEGMFLSGAYYVFYSNSAPIERPLRKEAE